MAEHVSCTLVVRELNRGALVTRIPAIRRVTPLSVAVEISLWARFEVVVPDAAGRVPTGRVTRNAQRRR